MADDKPDVHEDEHERTVRYFTELSPLILERGRIPEPTPVVERPIVWPVGMIPIKSDWKPHAFFGDQDSGFKCRGCGLSMHEHRLRQAEWEEEQR